MVSESGLNYTAPIPIPDILEKTRYFDNSDTIPINRPITKTFVILLRAGPQNKSRLKPVRSAKKFADPWFYTILANNVLFKYNLLIDVYYPNPIVKLPGLQIYILKKNVIAEITS